MGKLHWMMLLQLLLDEICFVDGKTMIMSLEGEEVRLCDLQSLSILWWIIPNDVDSIEVCVLWLDLLGW